MPTSKQFLCSFKNISELTKVELGLSALRLPVHCQRDVGPGVATVLHVGAVRDLVIDGRSDKERY